MCIQKNIKRTMTAGLGPVLAVLSALVSVPLLVHAADPPPSAGGGEIEEIVVTAEKRSSTVEHTPIAITAVTGKELSDRQLTSITDLQGVVPNFRIGMVTGGAVVTIRGIGSNNILPTVEGSAAVNINDVYVSRIAIQPLSVYDVSSLEVLRGPQGTLYGRNATAGAVNTHTTLPTDEFSGYVRSTIGNYNTVNVEGAIGGPVIGDQLLVRLAGRVEHHDGYALNIADGNRVDDRNTNSERLTIVGKPTATFTATVIAELGNENDNSGATHYFGGGGLTGLPGASGLQPLWIQEGGVDPGIRNVNNQVDPIFKLLTRSVIGNLAWVPNESFTLRSISGYRYMSNQQLIAVDAANPSSLLYSVNDIDTQYSEELQAIYSSQLVNVTLGGYYFNEDELVDPSEVLVSSDYVDNVICGGTCPPVQDGRYFTDAIPYRGHQKTDSEAAFGQMDFHVTEQVTLTAGIRDTAETKRMAQNLTPDFSNLDPLQEPYLNFSDYRVLPLGPYRSVSYHSVTPKFGIEYQVTPNVLAYATYSKGFKSGGFELSSNTPPFLPEKLTDYEGGIKARLFNGRATANLAGFVYDYTDLQVQQQHGLLLEITNAAKARVQGIEEEIKVLPIDHVRLDFSGAWLHSAYGQYIGIDSDRPQLGPVDYTGNRLSNAPALSGELGADYFTPIWHGVLTLRGELQYMTRYYLTPVNTNLESQAGFAKENFFLTYADSSSGWQVQLFVRNLTDRITKESYASPGTAFGNPFFGSVSPPRLLGADLSYHF
jgi:iron complex outermembrane recepter protein